MGSSESKAAIHVGEARTSVDGGKSAFTGALDEFCGPKEFWDLFVETLKEPLKVVGTAAALQGAGVKNHEVTEHPAGGWDIRTTFSAGLAGAIGVVGDLTVHLRVAVEREKDAATLITFQGADEGAVLSVTHAQLHSSPLCCEFWTQVAEGRRQSAMQHLGLRLFTGTALSTVPRAQLDAISVAHDTPSPGGSGELSVVSGPLDAFAEPEAVFGVFATAVREGLKKRPGAQWTERTIEDLGGGAVKYTLLMKDGSSVFEKHTVDEAGLHYTAERTLAGEAFGVLDWTLHVVGHRGPPFVLEHWVWEHARRQPYRPPMDQATLTALVEAMIQKAIASRGVDTGPQDIL